MMKLLHDKHKARVYKTIHGRFRIFIFNRTLLSGSDQGKYIVLYNNPFDEGVFINRLFQQYLIWFRGYELEYWGFMSSRTLVKKIKD